jgi:glycosyltransferase involved in cell wall biosynthesis
MTPMADRPLVTVITPVLNRASTITACLTSVSGQTYPHIEHVVVDGGSADGTVDVLRQWPGPRPMRWLSERDEGMYDAINTGLRMADGQVLCYLNSDDLYLPWSVEIAVEALSRGADLVFGDLAVLTRGAAAVEFFVQFYPGFDLPYYTHVASLGQPTVFWRRSLFDQIGGFDTSYRLIGDCEYWIRAGLANAQIEHVDEVLAVQVEHAATLRATQSDNLQREFARLRSEYAERIRPPLWPRWRRLRGSVTWRRRQLEFRAALRREVPDRWPRFVGFFRRRDVMVDDAALAFAMLPRRFRRRSPWGPPSELDRKLMQEIGIEG